ncbi:MAG: hypothetical protein KF883_01225 [Thermomicrobiales bacterium]|nr:hypothetical protein [Thermomicrobiales bacterium]
MILPTKRLRHDRALLTIGGEVLHLLSTPKTVSRVWEELNTIVEGESVRATVTFDWFVLSLDLLFTLDAIDLKDGLLVRAQLR